MSSGSMCPLTTNSFVSKTHDWNNQGCACVWTLTRCMCISHRGLMMGLTPHTVNARRCTYINHSVMCSGVLSLGTGIQVDYKAHTAKSGTWLTFKWLCNTWPLMLPSSSTRCPGRRSWTQPLLHWWINNRTIQCPSNYPTHKTWQHFSAPPHRFFGAGGFHLESSASLLFLTLFSLTQIRSATPLQIHFPNFSCLRRAPSAQGW